MLRNYFGLLNFFAICRVNVGGKEDDGYVDDEEDVDKDFENLQARMSVVVALHFGESNLQRQSNCIVDGEQNDKYLPVKLVNVSERNNVPSILSRIFRCLLFLVLPKLELKF